MSKFTLLKNHLETSLKIRLVGSYCPEILIQQSAHFETGIYIPSENRIIMIRYETKKLNTVLSFFHKLGLPLLRAKVYTQFNKQFVKIK